MPQTYTSRFILIFAVLGICMYAIFPVGMGKVPNLKPGIDMAGGTSLLYEIKLPAGTSTPDPNLAIQVMEALKRRVDPNGVRNLIWRPQGATRLEIQMPSAGGEEQANKLKDEFLVAQRALESTNIRSSDVIYAVEKLTGDARRDRLNELAMGSEKRSKLFGSLAATFDQREKARAEKNVAADVEADKQYEELKSQIDDTNLGIPDLQTVLDLKPETRAKQLATIRERFADFPKRLEALGAFEKSYDAFKLVKDNIGSAADLKRLLKGSGVLEFHILPAPGIDITQAEYQTMHDRLLKRGPGVRAGDQYRWYEVMKADQFHGPTVPYNDKQWVLASLAPGKQLINGPGINRWALESAHRATDPNTGRDIVGFRFDPQGAKYFSQLTGANIGKAMAIMLDDRVLTAPNINSQIGADGIITGTYTPNELKYLISTLSAGSLPAQLAEEPISERTIGSSVGEDNLRKGLLSCALGMIIVAIFLIGYYYLSGVVATIAVVMNVVLIIGSLAAFNATFTLPGIAGIVLTIAASVDANVLIFERLREEQQRGLSLRMAMRNAYDRAGSAILDSNATTLITSLILYFLGSEEVKGFGLTLLIGLIWSLFTALFVTKTIFGVMIDKWGITHLGSAPLTYPKWDRFLRPNVQWMKHAWIFMALSAFLIISGMGSFIYQYKRGQLLDIEFASGTAVQFELKNKMTREEVQDIVDEHWRKDPAHILQGASVMRVGTAGNEYEVVTPNADPVHVKTSVLSALGDHLKLDLPSLFDRAGAPVEDLVDKIIIPIQTTDQSIAGFTPTSLPKFVGGAAMILQNLDPPLTPQQIKDRVDRQRLQPTADKTIPQYHDFTVESPKAADVPTSVAVVLTSDPQLPYEKDAIKWRDELVSPMWKLVNEAVNRPAQLQKVSNFDAAVAADTTRDALMALVLSCLAILAYIWLRFGNLKYGTATVLAMLHDTLLVTGAVGLSHIVGNWAIGRAMLVEPFRINLTMVAAILTVMSYSMIDTIVVFDRIREIRGKFGLLSVKVVNDAINQTLSRTLLTVGITLLTLLIMYVWGGAGIHGFSYILLIGILVGSYSSIAIAAPILLIGAGKQQGESPAGTGQPPSLARLQKAGR